VREKWLAKKEKEKNLFQNSDNFSKSSFSFLFGWETERKWSVRCWLVGKSQKAVKAQKYIAYYRDCYFFPVSFNDVKTNNKPGKKNKSERKKTTPRLVHRRPAGVAVTNVIS
jgi:hypothetical protein